MKLYFQSALPIVLHPVLLGVANELLHILPCGFTVNLSTVLTIVIFRLFFGASVFFPLSNYLLRVRHVVGNNGMAVFLHVVMACRA